MATVTRTKQNLKKCICMKCPSYTTSCKITSIPVNLMGVVKGVDKASHMEGLFCAFGKSTCIKEEKGCICGGCDVFKENKLNRGYFCLR